MADIKIKGFINHHFGLPEKMSLGGLMGMIQMGHISDNQKGEFSENDTEIEITVREKEEG